MGKKQRSLLIDEDLWRIIDAWQGATGATITRIMTAAVIDYFFEHLTEPDQVWMRLAVALERGELSVPDLETEALRHEIKRLEHVLRYARAGKIELAKQELLKEHERRLNDARNSLLGYEREMAYNRSIGKLPLNLLLNWYSGGPGSRKRYDFARDSDNQDRADQGAAHEPDKATE